MTNTTLSRANRSAVQVRWDPQQRHDQLMLKMRKLLNAAYQDFPDFDRYFTRAERLEIYQLMGGKVKKTPPR